LFVVGLAVWRCFVVGGECAVRREIAVGSLVSDRVSITHAAICP